MVPPTTAPTTVPTGPATDPTAAPASPPATAPVPSPMLWSFFTSLISMLSWYGGADACAGWIIVAMRRYAVGETNAHSARLRARRSSTDHRRCQPWVSPRFRDPTKLTGTALMVGPHGAMLFDPYKAWQKFTRNGETIEQDVVDSSTWVRLDGGWKCAAHTETLVPRRRARGV